MIRSLERGLGARTRVPVRQLADLLEPNAGGITQRSARQDADEGTEINEPRPSRDNRHGPEYAPRGDNFLWVAHRAATYQLANTRYP